MINITYKTPNYKIIEDDLILFENTIFNENLIVKGNIFCVNGKHDLHVYGDIKAKSIDVNYLHAWNIKTSNIDAIDIDANVIICEKRTKKTRTSKNNIILLIENRSKLDFTDQMSN